jgi:hypothetical protein
LLQSKLWNNQPAKGSINQNLELEKILWIKLAFPKWVISQPKSQ